MRILCCMLTLAVCADWNSLALQAQTTASPPAETPAVVEATSEAAAPVDDEAIIRANAEKYVESYNRRDTQTMSSMWSPEAVYMDPRTGEGVVGREAIEELFDYILAGQEDAKLVVTIDSIEFVSPNVAIEKGTAVVSYSEHETEETNYTAVQVKRDGEWLLDRVSEEAIPLPPPSNYEHLKSLDWMIGSWIDADETATVQTDCEWTKNKNFMTRSFAVISRDGVEMSGMQVVGWDPATQQIRSWVFDSSGGFGDGIWTAKGDTWTIEATGTLSDGRKTSATNVLKKIDDDSYTWQSINRQADGELLPNVEEVMIVRAAEESAAETEN
ncbi:MAG: SgcJ/EcaC family oxidoreductase [Bythopirellula sp.]|nr:SgcJ/EcaC family oxidoreductase [Bythopirellula sp.]